MLIEKRPTKQKKMTLKLEFDRPLNHKPLMTSSSCTPCNASTPTLSQTQIQTELKTLNNWQVPQGHHLYKTFVFKDFIQALDFVNRVGHMAEKLQHHPSITFTYGRVDIQIYTHAIDGLSQNDFILAQNIDTL